MLHFFESHGLWKNKFISTVKSVQNRADWRYHQSKISCIFGAISNTLFSYRQNFDNTIFTRYVLAAKMFVYLLTWPWIPVQQMFSCLHKNLNCFWLQVQTIVRPMVLCFFKAVPFCLFPDWCTAEGPTIHCECFSHWCHRDVPFFPLNWKILTTDASLPGWGVVLGFMSVKRWWTPEESRLFMNLLKICAIQLRLF